MDAPLWRERADSMLEEEVIPLVRIAVVGWWKRCIIEIQNTPRFVLLVVGKQIPFEKKHG